jgi:hypothetical protein
VSIPNDTPFELLKTTVPVLVEFVPAEIATPPPPPPPTAEAVMVPLLNPKLTPFELEKTIVPAL